MFTSTWRSHSSILSAWTGAMGMNGDRDLVLRARPQRVQTSPTSLGVDQMSSSAASPGLDGGGGSSVAAMNSLSWMYCSQFLVDQDALRASMVPASMDHARFLSFSNNMREAIRVRSLSGPLWCERTRPTHAAIWAV